MTQENIDLTYRYFRWVGSNRIAPLLILLLLTSISFGCAAGSSIELMDGTTINGEVISMSNGRYVIHSPSLGRIELPESSIRSIQSSGGGTASGAANPDIQAIQQRIVNSPELMQLVNTMMSDPEIQEAVKDPEFIQLIMSGDLQALKDDPRILRLMNNPSMQAILGKMQ